MFCDFIFLRVVGEYKFWLMHEIIEVLTMLFLIKEGIICPLINNVTVMRRRLSGDEEQQSVALHTVDLHTVDQTCLVDGNI